MNNLGNIGPQDRAPIGSPRMSDAEVQLKRMIDQLWRRMQIVESNVGALLNAVDTSITTKRILSLIKAVNGHGIPMPDLKGENDDHDQRYVSRAAFGSMTGQIKLNMLPSGELTIAGGIITVTASYHTIDTESDAASDDLDTISGGLEGDLFFAVAANDARTVVLKHGTGNIRTHDGNDYSLDTVNKIALLLFTGTNWITIHP